MAVESSEESYVMRRSPNVPEIRRLVQYSDTSVSPIGVKVFSYNAG